MTKINWKVRVKSYPFWVALFGLAGMLVTDLTPMQLGTYKGYVDALLLLLIAGGVISDPTTEGMQDSEEALKYQIPKKRGNA